MGNGPLRAEVEAEVARLGLSDRVKLAGYRTDADAILATADVACLSSREEGMGSVLLDALAFGLAVAATTASCDARSTTAFTLPNGPWSPLEARRGIGLPITLRANSQPAPHIALAVTISR